MSSLVQRVPTTALPRKATSIQASDRWLYLFLVIQFVCQCALMAEFMGGRWRLYFRAATFISSLAMLGLIQGRAVRPHPVRMFGVALLVLMGFGLFHSEANIMAGIAHWFLNIAIWAPLFWVGRLAITTRTVWYVLLLLWGFNLLSSIVGVLQVYYPERFAPSAEFVRSLLGVMSEGLLIQLGDGRQVWRPFGLSDSPGGAAAAGSITVIIGLALFSTRSNRWVRLLSLLGISTGVFCIYICEIRSVMVITLLGAAVLLTLQVLQRRTTRAAATMLIFPLIVALGFSWTNTLSGNQVQRRVQTLSEGTATSVYYANRGRFIQYSLLDDLPKYPLGAGLGRYGMMAAYFTEPDFNRGSYLHAEVQLSGWLFDGGLLMIVLGYLAVGLACYTTFRIAVSRHAAPFLTECAAIITALNAGWLALTFTYCLFLSQSGLIFWMLNSAVFAASIAPAGTLPARKVRR